MTTLELIAALLRSRLTALLPKRVHLWLIAEREIRRARLAVRMDPDWVRANAPILAEALRRNRRAAQAWHSAATEVRAAWEDQQ